MGIDGLPCPDDGGIIIICDEMEIMSNFGINISSPQSRDISGKMSEMRFEMTVEHANHTHMRVYALHNPRRHLGAQWIVAIWDY